MFRLLLLEDDVDLGGALLKSLSLAGFRPVWTRRACDATDALMRHAFAALILDIEPQEGTGLEVLKELRERDDRAPVLLLSGRSAVGDRVRALECGADDYLTKPFAVSELIARIHALIRRSAGQAASEWRLGELRLDPVLCRVSLAGRALELSRREYRLLLELARGAGNVVPRARLEAAMFRSAEVVKRNLLEVHVCNLRRKLGDHARTIRTVHGVGYVLDA